MAITSAQEKSAVALAHPAEKPLHTIHHGQIVHLDNFEHARGFLAQVADHQ
ncbi:hypothetical protein [Acidovorax sp. SRB_24]|uniref:hypothetical protein n=1 Tax=Acidovorax sp. SRB_24 TaxID=1962700 RepID=UPI00145EF596|nr:hypothetical protein [Acidovorax sp. SRB_24]